jgi:hypothetical protein
MGLEPGIQTGPDRLDAPRRPTIAGAQTGQSWSRRTAGDILTKKSSAAVARSGLARRIVTWID